MKRAWLLRSSDTIRIPFPFSKRLNYPDTQANSEISKCVEIKWMIKHTLLPR
ncbi:hypothetical protein MTE2_4563 [Klebsiella pneumoniae VA360]|nr:hypothetical protein MTE2_4563 [Klebsiella pneumoniae VA360]